MDDVTLGKLERGWLRDLWKREDTHFTPWLALEPNIALLAEALGLGQLEDVQTEVPVGDFRLDLLARDTQTDTLVAVENQFWGGDHRHLGQLLTYAAGVSSQASKRQVFVWIAEEIKDEHRNALDWLNRVTEPNVGFFGVVLELWRIGASPFAPRFNIVSRPNDWQKKLAQETSSPSSTEQLYLDFWQSFIEFCGPNTTLRFSDLKGLSWIKSFNIRPGFGINLNAQKRAKWLECHLWIDHPKAKSAFEELLKSEDEIRAQLGGEVKFDKMEGRATCKIFESSSGDPANHEQWPQIFQWLKERGEAFAKVLNPLVKGLNLD